MVGDAHEVVAVGRDVDGELAVQAAPASSVVIAAKGTALLVVHVHDGIEWRTQGLRVADHIQLHPFLERHLEIVYVALLLDDAIKRNRLSRGRGSGIGLLVVWL